MYKYKMALGLLQNLQKNQQVYLETQRGIYDKRRKIL